MINFCLLTFLLLSSLSLSREVKDKESKTFFVIGDWGGLPNPPYETDIEKMISKKLAKLANLLEIDFLLALGDNFYYEGVESEYDSRFQTTFENVFNAKDLYFPWYVIAGNHDWRGNVSAQIAYSKHSNRWKFPDYFYTITERLPQNPNIRLAIIMIDTVMLCGQSGSDFNEKQTFEPVISQSFSQTYWKYIEKELIKYNNYTYVIVAGHYPVWSVSHHGPTKCLVENLDILLTKYNVSAYMNGHDHTLEHIQVRYGTNMSMNYFTIGASNFFDNSKKHEAKIPKGSLKFHWLNNHREGGFASVDVTENFLTVSFLSTDNKTLYTTKIKPRL